MPVEPDLTGLGNAELVRRALYPGKALAKAFAIDELARRAIEDPSLLDAAAEAIRAEKTVQMHARFGQRARDRASIAGDGCLDRQRTGGSDQPRCRPPAPWRTDGRVSGEIRLVAEISVPKIAGISPRPIWAWKPWHRHR